MARRNGVWRGGSACLRVHGLVSGLCAAVVLASGVLLPALPARAAADSRLAAAAERRDAGAVQALLDAHADPDAPQADGATALAWAAQWDDVAVADLLLRAGAGVDAANDLGVTPLMLASTNGSTAMVERLLQAGADPNAARPAGAPGVVRQLLAAGCDVNQATRGGHTALMWAAAERHAPVVTLLAEVGADIGARTAVRARRGRPVVREAKVLSRVHDRIMR